MVSQTVDIDHSKSLTFGPSVVFMKTGSVAKSCLAVVE